MRLTKMELNRLQSHLEPLTSIGGARAVVPSRGQTPFAPTSADTRWIPSIQSAEAAANLAALDEVLDLPLPANVSGSKTHIADLLRDYGPTGDFDRVDYATLERREPLLRAIQERAYAYRGELAPVTEKSGTIEELRAIQAKWAIAEEDGIPYLPTKDRIALVQAFHEKGAWQDVIDAWHELCTIHPQAAQDEIALESLVVALQKRGEQLHKSDRCKPNVYLMAALETATGIARRAIPEGEINYDSVRGNRLVNAEVLSAGLGKTYRLIATRIAFHFDAMAKDEGECLDSGEVDTYRRFLAMEMPEGGPTMDLKYAADRTSFRYYLAAFGRDHHYYPGWNAYFEAYKVGDSAEMKRLSPLVWEAIERAGGAEATEFWALATYVQFAAIEGNTNALLSALTQFLVLADDQWKVGSTLDTVEKLDTPAMTKLAEILRPRLAALIAKNAPSAFNDEGAIAEWVGIAVSDVARAAGIPWAAPVEDGALERRREITAWLTKNTTSLEQLANSDMVGGSYSREIGGNARHGGQIVDTEVNRYTRRKMLEILEEYLDLAPQHERAGEFWNLVETVHSYVRKQLTLVDEDGNATVEDLKGPAHHVLNGVNKGLIEVCQVPKGGDSSTNLIHIAAGGFGDCRPTDLIVNYALVLALTELKHHYRHQIYHSQEADEVAHLLSKIESMNRYQIVGASVAIWGNMKVVEKYEYDLDPATGRPYPSDKFVEIEDHNLTECWEKDDDGLVKMDEHGPIVWAIDGFYQDDVYHLRKKRLYLKEVVLGEGDQAKPRLVFDAGDMAIRNSEGGPIRNYFEFRPWSGAGVQKRLGSWGGASLAGLDGPDISARAVLNRELKPLNEEIAAGYWQKNAH